jgi:hypothetical protein
LSHRHNFRDATAHHEKQVGLNRIDDARTPCFPDQTICFRGVDVNNDGRNRASSHAGIEFSESRFAKVFVRVKFIRARGRVARVV